ncbi:GreA/GreB family elongation factor [Vibrio genomosp. F10 str. 9ZC157]|uniref:Transcription elongation factor n=1 Tax=Vibrio genomosp. F10 str. ZF-129 TaxID=1187848 RepID=A0A1E5BKJ0_9VIBR|nr:GreA/GreB family elongation factor [Vibrio genomosp. F10]OEE38397.1 transcription elongation factor [Vibrio genomosp. F10 str. ZF-129]OEE98275.1 transcription elongation factor [Vibrio genomosp. F10 str. 9ZC157]
MNKLELKQIILISLNEKWEIAKSATQRAIDAATDEETVPEHKYDTLALEASYLAHGQALRVQECKKEIQQFESMVFHDLKDEKVALGSYVTLLYDDDKTKHLFMGPCSGGVTVNWQDRIVSVITPLAPLGKAMLGKKLGEEVELKVGDSVYNYEIIDIH